MGVDVAANARKRKDRQNEEEAAVLKALPVEEDHFNSPEGIHYSNQMNVIERVTSQTDIDGDGFLNKKEMSALLPQLEKAFGKQATEEMAAKLANMPDDKKFKLPNLRALADMQSGGLQVMENGGTEEEAMQYVKTRALEIREAQSNPVGQNIDKVSEDISNLLNSADNGKGWTAFKNDGVLKGKEIDGLIETLSQEGLSGDTIPQALKSVLEEARANGEKINIDQLVSNMRPGLENIDQNFDGALNPAELLAAQGGDKGLGGRA